MSGFTKGPWTFDGPPDNHIVWASEQGRICFMAHSAGVDPEGDTANARLVASAPDLLEALQTMIADFGDYPASERPCRAFDMARAAIRKANGVTS